MRTLLTLVFITIGGVLGAFGDEVFDAAAGTQGQVLTTGGLMLGLLGGFAVATLATRHRRSSRRIDVERRPNQVIRRVR
jgi:hypothetical protein